MPTFTSVTLDRFLEPEDSSKSPKRNMPTMEKKIHFSDSSFSFPPSPHMINHKRQESPLFNNFSQGQEEARNGNGKDLIVTPPVLGYGKEVVKTYDKFNGFQNGKLHNISLEGTGDVTSMFVSVSPNGDVSDDFFDPRESLSVTSSVEAEDNIGWERNFKPNTPMSEFYDAYEELSEGGSQSSCVGDVEAELRERRLSWLMEIEGRKQAEEALENMKRQWDRLTQKLLLEGLTLASASSSVVREDEKLETDPAEELCQQIRLARAVSTSVGRGAAKAEAEMESESKIQSKNFEIARLLQRLQYYETVNAEMSLRNQEATATARCLTQKRKRRRERWIWGAVGASVVLGSMALAWSLLPTTDSFDAPDGESASNGNELPN